MPYLDLSNLKDDLGVSRKEHLLVDLTIDDDQVIVAKRPRVSIVDLTGDDDAVKRRRCVPPLENVHNHVVIELQTQLQKKSLVENIRQLSRDLILIIFDEYLRISFIKEILMTPTDILRTSICIHNSMISRHVAPKFLMDSNALWRYIFDHIGHKAPLNIIYANINLRIITSLQVNDTFDYYEPHRKGKFIVTKVLKNSAVVQKIQYSEKKLLYNGLTFITMRKVSPKRTISFRILNERCVFSSIRNQSICFVNNLGTPSEVVYYTNCGLIVQKHRDMAQYEIV